MSDGYETPKTDLLRALGEIECEAKQIEIAARSTLESARLMRDAAPKLRILYEGIPFSAMPPSEWTRQHQNAEHWLGAAKSISAVTDASPFVPMSQAAANTAISGIMSVASVDFALSGPMAGSPTAGCPLFVQQAAREVAALAEKHPRLESVRQEILRLRLDVARSDTKSPLQLLDEARLMLDIPVTDDGRSASALLTLRSCIDACVSELIRRRPQQEETRSRKAKITSLGAQCTRIGLTTAHFDKLGIEADILQDQLSAAKQKDMSRQQIETIYFRGLLFLGALLGSIDETKLRNS